MEQTRNSPNGNNKMLIKPAGIGAVVLLGGALASAFALLHKRRSSGEEVYKKSEDDILREEEVESENDSTVVISNQSFRLGVDTDGKKEESPLLGEKFKAELVKEHVSDNHQWKEAENSKEWEDQEDNGVEEDGVDESESKECEGGEINEEKCAEVVLEEDGVEGKEVLMKGENGKENIVEGRRWEKGVWEVKVMKYEVGGKMKEEREIGLWMNEGADSSRRRRGVMIIWMMMVVVIVSAVSSILFHLSTAKLALILFLTLFLLEIYGYSPLNHHHSNSFPHA